MSGTDPTQLAPSDVARGATVASDADIGTQDTRAAGTEATLASMPPAGSGRVRIASADAAQPDYAGLREVDRGHYVIGGELARGGMGRILVGRDRRLARSLAIKELLVEDSWLRARFEREVRITARLQHPSIVGVHEAGLWPTGEAFYAMPLVKGRSLDQAIAERSTLQARMELLPNVIAAVDALAYAHSERVIHRDLKPANVLVGRYGETVVIDWGLAKLLDDPETAEAGAEAGPYRVAGATADETRAGTVMGTPAYMPVEQARGEALDERADVFALGAMLYHVLCGAPPYTGRTADAILDAVLAGPPPALASRVAGVPRDLIAIVDKALARDASARYATAAELAVDLKRFQTGQLVGAHSYTAWQLLGRWVRRHRTAVLVGAAALVVLVVGATVSVKRIFAEQARTQAQSVVAEKNRQQAEGLMGFMLNNLRGKLAPLGKLDLLDDVANQAVAYYDARGAIADDREAAQRALVLQHVGEVRQAQGKLEVGLGSLRTSLSMFEQLAAKQPADPQRQRDVANALGALGEALDHKRDPATLATLEKARDIWKRLAAENPTSDVDQRGLGQSELSIGKTLTEHGDDAASAHLTVAATILKARAAAAPDDRSREADLFEAQRRIATHRFDQHDTEGAIAAQHETLGLITKLVSAEPTNAYYRRDEMLAHYLLGIMLCTHGDAEDCVSHLTTAVASAGALADANPTSMSARHDLASVLMELSDTKFALGELPEAKVHAERAADEMQALVAHDRANAQWQLDVAKAQRSLANALLRSGDATAALPHYDAAITALQALVALDPSKDDVRASLAMAHQNRTRCLLHLNRLDDASKAIAEAVTTQQAVVDKHPDDPSLRADLAAVQQMQGDVLFEGHNPAAALPIYEVSLATKQAILDADPADVGLAMSITMSYERIADVSRALKQPKARAEALAAARALADKLGHEHPDDPRIQQRIAELKALR